MYLSNFNDIDLTSLHCFIRDRQLISLYGLELSRIHSHLNDNSLAYVNDETIQLPIQSSKGTKLFPRTKTVQSCVPTFDQENLIEKLEVDRLICLFNYVFCYQNVILVRGHDEPEYFPATYEKPAQLVFAHGFLSSALHELSHWTIAGAYRRTLTDFGYGYIPDGRSLEQQQIFEQVEIKPQAIECLFTMMLNKTFKVSNDNLNAKYNAITNTFGSNVLQQVQSYLKFPDTIPKDAKIILTIFSYLCHDT